MVPSQTREHSRLRRGEQFAIARRSSVRADLKFGLMTKKKLIDEIKLNPSRYYRVPSDVKRDRRFTDAERLEILAAWERDARAVSSENHDDGEPTVISELRQVLEARREM